MSLLVCFRIQCYKCNVYSVIYREDSTNEIFFDPNKLSEDGTTALSQTSWSEDGKLMGYMLRFVQFYAF